MLSTSMKLMAVIFAICAAAASAQTSLKTTAATQPTIILKPNESLAAAIDQARSVRGGPSRPVRIVIDGGTYFLDEPIVLTPDDSNLTLVAAPGAKAVISGGERIVGWQPAKLNGLDCWSANVSGAAAGWFFRELWIDGRRATRARSPDHGYFHIKDAPDAKAWQDPVWRVHYQDSDVPPAPWSFGTEMIVMDRWVESRLPLGSDDLSDHLANFLRLSQFTIDRNDPYWLEGDARFLNAPGEWFLDRNEGRIYYLPLPGQQPAKIDAIAPKLAQLLRLQGDAAHNRFVENVAIKGLTFSHTEWNFPEVATRPGPATRPTDKGGFDQAAFGVPGAINGNGVRRLTLDHCTIEHIGDYGIELAQGCSHNMISHCRMIDLGAGGVRIGQSSIPKTQQAQSFDNEISDCEIANAGNMFPSAVGIWIGQSFDNHIAHNSIHDLFYSGISAGWSWGYGDSLNRGNVIEFNNIHHIGAKHGDKAGAILSDMGGIYLLGARNGSVVCNNRIHDIRRFKYGGWGIYLDEGSSDTVIENNVVYDTTDGAFHQHYGKDNLVRNNIFAFGGKAQVVRTLPEPHQSFTFEHNIVYWENGPLIASTKTGLTFDDNLYGGITAATFRAGGLDWQAWQAAGMDTHSVLANPMFMDIAKRDLQLKPNSPAAKIGFVPFDMTSAGIRR